MVVWSTSSASMRLRADRGLAVVEFVGALQPHDAAAFYERCVLEPGQDAQVVLVDVRGLHTAAPALCLLPPVGGPAGLGLLPGAMLVRPDEYALYRAYAWALAERRGVIRGVFTEAAPALAWMMARAQALAPSQSPPSARAWQAAAHDVLAPLSPSSEPLRTPRVTLLRP